MNETKIAICFFGLTRSLKYTIDSIRRNIFQPLQQNKYNYDIYIHTYSVKSDTQDPDEFNLLNPDFYSITDQDEFLNTPIVDSLIKYGDDWGNSYISLKNLLCQLNSLRLVTDMWNKPDVNYNCVMYFRPDLLYHQPI